jgi:hypothetical protein
MCGECVGIQTSDDRLAQSLPLPLSCEKEKHWNLNTKVVACVKEVVLHF